MSIGTLTLCGKRGWDPPSFNRLVLKAFTASNPGAARRGQGLCMTVTCSPLACRGSSVAVSWGSETSRAAAAPRVCSGGGTPHSQTYRPWTTSRVAADHVPGGGGPRPGWRRTTSRVAAVTRPVRPEKMLRPECSPMPSRALAGRPVHGRSPFVVKVAIRRPLPGSSRVGPQLRPIPPAAQIPGTRRS